MSEVRRRASKRDGATLPLAKLAEEFIGAKVARERMASQENKLKKHLMGAMEESLEPTDDGHRFLEFPDAIHGYAGIQRQRRVSVSVDEEGIIAYVSKHDKLSHLLVEETRVVLDESALQAAIFEGLIPDEDIEQFYTENESFACVPIKA